MHTCDLAHTTNVVEWRQIPNDLQVHIMSFKVTEIKNVMGLFHVSLECWSQGHVPLCSAPVDVEMVIFDYKFMGVKNVVFWDHACIYCKTCFERPPLMLPSSGLSKRWSLVGEILNIDKEKRG